MEIYSDDKVIENFHNKCLDTLALFALPESPFVYCKEKGTVRVGKKLLRLPVLPDKGRLKVEKIKDANCLARPQRARKQPLEHWGPKGCCRDPGGIPVHSSQPLPRDATKILVGRLVRNLWPCFGRGA